MALDPRERFAGLEEVLRLAMSAERAGMWTALPGAIVSFDPETVTAVVRPLMKGVTRTPDGTAQDVDLPYLPDVPVIFPRGGGVTLTFPVAEGDECLVVFSSRCIDGWYQSGEAQLPMEPRFHDINDGFAILGPQSLPNKIENISTTTMQLRTDDGLSYLELDPDTGNWMVQTEADVAVNCAELTATTTGNAHLTVGGDLGANVDGDVIVTAGGDLTAQASGTASLTAAAITLNGPVVINGTLNVTEAVTLDDDLGVSGDLNGNTGDFSGTLTAQGTNLHLHKHVGGTIAGNTGFPIP